MDSKVAFKILKPFCTCLLKEPSRHNVLLLHRCVEEIIANDTKLCQDGWTSVMNDLKEYISFPLVLILKIQINESFNNKFPYLEVFQVLHSVMSASSNMPWAATRDILHLTFSTLTDLKNPQKISKASEECKTEALSCLQQMLKNSSSSVCDEFVSSDFQPQLGHSVYVCLKLAQEEKAKNVRIEALQTLLCLGLKSHWSELSVNSQSQLSDRFASFLPGISLALTKIIKGPTTQGHKITALSIESWHYFVMLVMRDSFLGAMVPGLGMTAARLKLQQSLYPKDNLFINNNEYKHKEEEGEDNLSVPRIHISREWVESTSSKLSHLIKSIEPLVTHTHWRVREELVEWSLNLITKCSLSLHQSLMTLLTPLLCLTFDSYESVASRATRYLQECLVALKQCHLAKENLTQLATTHFLQTLTTLPAVCRSQDDLSTLNHIRKVQGILQILDSDTVLRMPHVMSKLIRSLGFALTVSSTDVVLLAENELDADAFLASSSYQNMSITFRYFQSPNVFNALSSLCSYIGRHSHLLNTIDCCLQMFNLSSTTEVEAVIVMKFILKGAIQSQEETSVKPNEEENLSVVKFILESLLNSRLFCVPIQITQKQDSFISDPKGTQKSVVPIHSQHSLNVDIVKHNVLLVSNALSLIGTCALLTNTRFKEVLSSVLSIVLEKAGDCNTLVSNSALQTLNEFSTALGYDSIALMIDGSFQHFWFDVALKLKRLKEYPNSPQVLKFALKCNRGEIKVFVIELVEDLLESLDLHHTESNISLPLLCVLLIYVQNINNNFNDHKSATMMSVGSFTNVENSLTIDDHQMATFDGKSPTDCSINCNKNTFVNSANNNAKNNTNTCIKVFLQEYHHNHMVLQQELENTSKDMENIERMQENVEGKYEEVLKEEIDDNYGDDEKKVNTPKHIELVAKILERCSFLLYVRDRRLQLLLLNIVQQSCQVLDSFENERLPAMHKLWRPLVLCLQDKDFVVLLQGLDALCSMVLSSSDFFKVRFLKELFPLLLSFLQTQSHTSIGKTRQSGYFITPAYKTQCRLLDHLPSIIQSLQLSETDLLSLLNSLLPLLDNRQPSVLLTKVLIVLRTVAALNSDLLWLHLMMIREPVRISAECEGVEPIVIKGRVQPNLSTEVIQLCEELS